MVSENIRSFTIFLLAGGLTALLYIGSLIFFLEILTLNYHVGVSIAYLMAISFHFTMSRWATFRAHDYNFIPQMIRYLAFAGFNYLLTLAVAWLCVEILRTTPYIGVVVAAIVTTGMGFIISKNWIFEKASSHG